MATPQAINGARAELRALVQSLIAKLGSGHFDAQDTADIGNLVDQINEKEVEIEALVAEPEDEAQDEVTGVGDDE